MLKCMNCPFVSLSNLFFQIFYHVVAWILGHIGIHVFTTWVTCKILIFSFSLVKGVAFPLCTFLFQIISNPLSPLLTNVPFVCFPVQCHRLPEACCLRPALPHMPAFRILNASTAWSLSSKLPSRAPAATPLLPWSMSGLKDLSPLLASLSATLKSCHRHILLVSNMMHESDISFYSFIFAACKN